MDLYALPPEEFTAARDAAAKVDKALKALRRPTVSAWVVNTLVRRDPDLLEQLVGLGQELGQAQSGGDAAALRTLGEQRRQLVGAVTQRAVELAERDVSAAARLEVEQTLEAALVDPASAEAVRTGNLTRPLAFAGFGGVDLAGAVADLPPARPVISGTRKADGRPRTTARASLIKEGKGAGKRVARLEQAALEAQGALDDAVRHAEVAAKALAAQEQELEQAQQDRDAADEAVQQAKEALASAEEQAKGAQHRRTQVKKDQEEADRKAARATAAVEKAQQAAEAARTALDAARRG